MSSPTAKKPPLTIQQIIDGISSLRDSLEKSKTQIPEIPSVSSAAVAVISPPPAPTDTGSWTSKDDNDEKQQSDDGSSQDADKIYLQLKHQLDVSERDLDYIQNALKKLATHEQSVSDQFEFLKLHGDGLYTFLDKVSKVSKFPTRQVGRKVKDVNDMVVKLKLMIPLPHKMSAENPESQRAALNEIDARILLDEMSKLHESFKDTTAFKDYEELFKQFGDTRLKLCLLCFAVFPENAVIKKRLLTYWWIGEDFAEMSTLTEAEKRVEEDLKKLMEKGFIEPVFRKYKLVGFKMHPLIRCAVINFAKNMRFLDVDDWGDPTADFQSTLRACLVKMEDGSSGLKFNNNEKNPEKLQMIFNVNYPYPDFKLDWFSRMKNVNILCLGSWEDSVKRHIEVEGIQFLQGLENTKYLRFLSLQGVSRITELPDVVCNLSNLRILDLKGCHDLERLPGKISYLNNLAVLDVSECYLLDQLPREIGSLSNLEVLKGFVISDLASKGSCTLSDLAKLHKLKKLTIHTNRKDFPRDEELMALNGLETLQKLKLAWGGKELKSHRISKQTKDPKDVKAEPVKPRLQRRAEGVRRSSMGLPKELPPYLKKLDLQCFPLAQAPNWLRPHRLGYLEKLYIRGGNFQDLHQVNQDENKANPWTVKILRLKYLPEMKMNWIQLQGSFPDLVYLEKVKCPKLTFFPCNESGVWVARTEEKQKLLEAVEQDFSWSSLSRRTP